MAKVVAKYLALSILFLITLTLLGWSGGENAWKGKPVLDHPTATQSLMAKERQSPRFLTEKAVLKVQAEEVEDREKKDKKEKKTSEPVYGTEKWNGDYRTTLSLNVRSGPGTDYEVMWVLAPDTKAIAEKKATRNGSLWYYVHSDGRSGWAAATFLTDDKQKTETPTKVERPKKAKAEKKKVEKKKVEKKKEEKKAYQPNTIYFNGKAVPYKNGGREKGQHIIDSSSYASTWGGVSVFRGNDEKNTHFIGHNPGNFTGIQHATSFIITDGDGNAFTYIVDRVYKVDDYAVGTHDQKNYWERITGTGGGERVTFQTCLNDDINWIIEASVPS